MIEQEMFMKIIKEGIKKMSVKNGIQIQSEMIVPVQLFKDLWEMVKSSIRRCLDDPNYKGKPPEYLTEMETEMRVLLTEGKYL